MNLEVKAKWLEALRSGKYKQGVGSLKQLHEDEIKHCCLGVLCDLARLEGIVIETTNTEVYSFESDNESQYLYPPTAVYKWAGLTDDEAKPYARNNDEGYTFHQIANSIESNL